MTMSAHERHIPFEGVHNFRDLGGYRTTDAGTIRRRTLFRCGEMQNMTESDFRICLPTRLSPDQNPCRCCWIT